MVKNLPGIWETLPWALGQKDLLEKEWKPTPVFLPEELHGLRSWWPTAHGVAELDMTESLTLPPCLATQTIWNSDSYLKLRVNWATCILFDSPINVLKSRDITLPTKVRIVKAMVFPVVMYGCEKWTPKKTEHWSIAFKVWCWRRLLWVPWTARSSNQSILKKVNPEYSLEGLIWKLTL